MALLAAVGGQAPGARAAVITYGASLNGAIEGSPNASPGRGNTVVTIDANTMSGQIEFADLLSPTTASHIHCCTATPFDVSATALVATMVPTFPGFPLGVTSGTYFNTFDLTDPATYNPAFITAHGGTVAGAEAALLA